jgi:hypothetical protein
LDYYFYAAKGDIKSFSGGLTIRYISNDITAQKKSELESFLAAGYPVVADPTLYALPTANYFRIGSTTNIYKFISAAKTSSSLLNYSDYTNIANRLIFLAKLRYKFNILRPIVDLEAPIISDTSPVNYVYADPTTHKLSIRFKLLPKYGVPSIYTYNAYLYLDKNGDGIFEASEKLDVSSRDGSSWTDMRESNSLVHIYDLNMIDLNGVYQWKIVVERANKTDIRATLTGYVANSKPEDIYILQITDNASTYRLSEMILNSTKLISQYAGAGKLTDYRLHFDTMTVNEYQQQFVPTAYNSSNPAATGKLSKYHILIMDNPTNAISNTNGAVNNIKDEINRNLGVIYTKGALGYSNQSSYYDAAKNSFIYYDSANSAYNYTYNYINRYSLYNSDPNPLFIYSGMKGDNDSTDLKNDSTYSTIYLTKSNEGSITQYPYKLNGAIKIASNSYSNNAVIDYDLTTNQRLIGWYCLSDTRSPVVRKVFNLGTVSDLYYGVYSSSPNDVKNNYYLFSNGTCYYSGIKLATADASGNLDEMRLFVNTIIACRKTAWNRAVSTAPEIVITTPTPAPQPDGTQKITITESNITGGDFILRFKMIKSSSNMDLGVMFNATTEPAGTWDDIVYPSDVAGNLGAAIAINNTSKVLQKDVTYAIRIPVSLLVSTNKLTLKATNTEGNTDTEEVYLEYIQPPVVTIEKPEVSSNTQASYIYVDLDYSGESNLSSEAPLRVEFKVDKALTNVTLSFHSGADSLTDGGADDVKVYKITGGVEATVALAPGTPTSNSNYALYIPANFIRNTNSRELKITATDTSGLIGYRTVVILRRSLFPLD